MWIGTKSDTRSDSHPIQICFTLVRKFAFTLSGWIILGAHAPWSLARSGCTCFRFVSQSSKTFVSNFLCAVTMQSDPNVFGIPSLFSKAISHWMMSIFPPDPGLSQPNSKENFEQRFSRYVFPFHTVLFIKEQFFFGLSLSAITYPLQKYPDKSFTLSV